MKIKKIFLKKYAFYLRERGFKIIGTEINRYKPELDVYLFEDTPELQQAMTEYTTNRRTATN